MKLHGHWYSLFGRRVIIATHVLNSGFRVRMGMYLDRDMREFRMLYVNLGPVLIRIKLWRL